MRAVDHSSLVRWRSLDATHVLRALADYAKQDVTFHPLKDHRTTRWHACIRGCEFELLLTGPKFWDTRAEKGGGGAVDLTRHLTGVGFTQAAELLTAARL
jgi:hypothetical protein